MEESGQRRNACTKNVQILLRREGCALIIKHGAKVQLCSSDGCTNPSKKRGLCRRHGAYRTLHDESTAFGSELEQTTATQTLADQRASIADGRRRCVPGEVTIVCQEIVEV